MSELGPPAPPANSKDRRWPAASAERRSPTAGGSKVREASASLQADLHSRFVFDFDVDGNEDCSSASVGPSSRPSRFETQLRKMSARSVGGGAAGDGDDVSGGVASALALSEPAPRLSPETSGSIYRLFMRKAQDHARRVHVSHSEPSRRVAPRGRTKRTGVRGACVRAC